MSNPIHSTSAKSVLPMLAMRGLATGLCAGCVVGLLRLSHDRAAARVALWLEEWREVWWTVPIWFGVLVALAVILRRIVREEPLISGSGIPQTELALAGRLSFTWWRVLLAKFLGSWLALFGRACPWPGRPEHPDGRGRGRGVSCALEAGRLPMP